MKLRTKWERDEILTEIFKLYPTKTIELDFDTPFQLLAAVMLSAQMTDKGVNKATKKLFEIVKTPADLLKLQQEKVEVMLRGVNYYRVKTKHLFMTAEKLTKDIQSKNKFVSNITACFAIQKEIFKWETVWAGWKPDTWWKQSIASFSHLNRFGTFSTKSTKEALDYLQTLPWVGVKTAKVVLSHLYDMPFIGVDTHIHRVMNRMGIVKTKTPEETDKKLEKLLSEDQKRTMHHAIVLFGRYICTAKKCKCSETPLAKWCGCEECRKWIARLKKDR
jgi:endonuclease III